MTELSENNFTHDSKVYNLTKVRILTRPEKAFLLPISQLIWVLNHDTPSEERIAKAKLRYPLLVTRWRGKWTVVDGLHRLEKYRRKGIAILPVKEVSPEMLRECLVSTPHKA